MDEKQINFLDFTVNIQLDVLRTVRQEYQQNKKIDDFTSIVDETKRKTIINLENFILLPTYKFIPLTRIFKEEDLPIRQEISKEVNKRFENFIN